VDDLRMHKDIETRLPAHRNPARRDFFRANIVELGINLQKERGTAYAARFMKDNWISLDVATRVLLYPTRRRAIVATRTEKVNLPDWNRMPELHSV